MSRVCCAIVVFVAVGLCGCRSIAGTDVPDVEAARAAWVARGITSYRYDVNILGGNLCASPVRVYVQANQQDSVIELRTGQPYPVGPQVWPACAPTVLELFDQATKAAQTHRLGGIRYAREGYPAEIDYPGPPDASSTIYASNLHPMP